MDVTTYLSFHVNLSDREWRSITKGLALLAGIKVTVSPEERTAAAELNTAMLEQRARVLAEQLRVAQGAVDKAKEAEGKE